MGRKGLIAALRSAFCPEGTLVMPSMTADDDHPFDPRATCIGMGIVAQTFWQLPGVLRSDPHASCRGWPAGCPYHRPAPGGCPAWIGQPGWPGI